MFSGLYYYRCCCYYYYKCLGTSMWYLVMNAPGKSLQDSFLAPSPARPRPPNLL